MTIEDRYWKSAWASGTLLATILLSLLLCAGMTDVFCGKEAANVLPSLAASDVLAQAAMELNLPAGAGGLVQTRMLLCMRPTYDD